MNRLHKLRSFKSTARPVRALNIAASQIAPPLLCPTSSVNTFKDGNKKVDYALALLLTKKEESVLNSAVSLYRVEGGASINQTHGWTAVVPMFAHIEVKVDECDPMIQLAIWICAEAEKRYLEGYTLDLPFVAIAVNGEDWSLSIAHSEKLSDKEQQLGGKPYRVQFLGSVRMGHTGDAAGVFRILHVLKAIVRWGQEIYEPQFMKHVYARYKKG
ncbi:MAG: hypothetical protein Q9172_006287 [Xanthocarpia lactea]